MTSAGLTKVLKAALLAGIGAGLVVAAFHMVVTEPVIDQAIAVEGQMAGEHHDEAPIVSREAQRGGLVLGFAVYGIAWGLLFTLVYQIVQRWLPPAGAPGKGWFLALALYWAVGLFPFLKYPANPPGVGDPETIAYRQGLYLGFLVLSTLATLFAIVMGRSWSGKTTPGRGNWLAGLGFFVVAMAVLYVGMPVTTDPVEQPADLMLRFRILSVTGLTLFWLLFGLGFARLVRPAAGAPMSARTS
ncbi:MAG: CbtA family protein [Chloroflexi bacterium]|nr:CbtA family protein [Chloroflexota bacterium]